MSTLPPFAGPEARLAAVPELILRGELEEAARRCTSVLEAAPAHALAEYFMGVVAYERGADREAEDALRRAVLHAREPALRAAAWQGLARLYERRTEIHQALDALTKAIAAEPTVSAHRVRLAEALLGAGRAEEAENLAREALRINPADGPAYGVLAEALVRRDRIEEALAVLTEGEHRLGEDPRARAAVLGLRARIAAMRGDLAAAEAAYRATLDADPAYPGYAALAEIHDFRGRDDPLLAWLLARRENAGAETREDIAYALGKAWEDLGATEEAFAAYADGARRARPAHATQSVEQIERREAALRVGFGEAFFNRAPPLPPGGFVPVFIVGLPRSGSTLLEQMLAAHPEIRAGGELPYAPRLALALLSDWYARGACPPAASEEIASGLKALSESYERASAPRRQNARVFTDKALSNYQYVGLLAAAFPRSVFLHIHKSDALDHCWGIFRRHLRQHDYAYDFADLARVYRSYRRLVAHWRRFVPAERLVDVSYERLVAEPEATIREILDRLALPFDPACLHPERVGRPVATASLVQVRRPIQPDRIGSAQAFAPWLAPLRQYLDAPEENPPGTP